MEKQNTFSICNNTPNCPHRHAYTYLPSISIPYLLQCPSCALLLLLYLCIQPYSSRSLCINLSLYMQKLLNIYNILITWFKWLDDQQNIWTSKKDPRLIYPKTAVMNVMLSIRLALVILGHVRWKFNIYIDHKHTSVLWHFWWKWSPS